MDKFINKLFNGTDINLSNKVENEEDEKLEISVKDLATIILSSPKEKVK